MTESPNFESNNVKKKKKKKKLVNKSNPNESSKQMVNAEYSNAKTETVTNNFSANSIKTIDMHSNEMDSDCLKLKKKRKRLKNKDNSIAEGNVFVPNEAETMSDIAFNDSFIRNNNLPENDSDSNTLKMKKKKLKNKFKKIDKSSQSNNFSDVTETISDTVFDDSSVRENSLARNNSDSFKKIKKKLKNSEKSLECNEFFDEPEPTTFEVSRDLLLKKNNLLQSKAYQKLQAAKFRYLNEMLYTNSGKDALSYFQENTDEYLDYHLGYQSQVSKWPINPVDIIIQEISRM